MIAGKIVPFGYSVPNALAMLDQLMADENAYLVDIRSSVRSLKKPAWSFEKLRERYGKRYLWIRDLGNVNYLNHGPIHIAHPEVGIPRLINGVQQGFTLILLCTCARYESCHRKVVVELLQKVEPSVEVVHLGLRNPPESADILKCISIQQPYAWLFLHQDVLMKCRIPPKSIENREWRTDHRGRLLIHTGRSVDPDLFHQGKLDRSYWISEFGSAGDALYAAMPQSKKDYPLGAIVGEATLVDVVTESQSPWFTGRYGLVLRNIQAFETPVPYPGALKIFDVPANVIAPAQVGTEPRATIYVDEIRTYETTLPHKQWCHMATSGDIEALHRMASELGLKREWFQSDPRHPHYDLTPGKRAQAIQLGAVPVSSYELLERCWPSRATEPQSRTPDFAFRADNSN